MRQKVEELQGVPFNGNVQFAAQKLSDEYRANFPANANLDDGTYYYGMDDKSPVKPKISTATVTAPKVTATPASLTTIAPPKGSSNTNSGTASQNKDVVPPKRPEPRGI